MKVVGERGRERGRERERERASARFPCSPERKKPVQALGLCVGWHVEGITGLMGVVFRVSCGSGLLGVFGNL